MYTLYYSPGACSLALHVILSELNVPFTLQNVSIQEGKNRSAEFLALNPRGQVPVLVHDGLVLREGAAILLYLLEKHSSPLLPTSGKARSEAIEWLMFANATLHPAYSRVFFLLRNAKDEKEKAALLGTAFQAIRKLWAEVETRLESHPFICGHSPTVADILLTVIANWTLPEPIEFGTHTKTLLKTISTRPSYQKALQTEGGTYKAA